MILFRRQLMTIIIMLLVMVVIGGMTRLTNSGLSMVVWDPILGFLPPLNNDDWVKVFNLYMQTPEYLLINKGMSLSEFKSIFWLEFIHRLWGRLMGIALLVPLVYSWISKELAPYRFSMCLILCLGLLQGFVGWWMVKSGLMKDPHVSPYRLAAHLLLALFTYTVLLLVYFKTIPRKPTVSKLDIIMGLLILFVIFYGALVAGFKAGLIYNEFPYMGDSIIPEDLLFMDPVWINFFSNPAAIQFTHRTLATGLLLMSFLYALKLPRYRIMLPFVLLQLCLGIVTLLYAVPVLFGVIHQLMAFIVWGVFIYVCHKKDLSKTDQ
jgi:cytochrome c oxidase assembly protein subunit 15